MSSYEPFGELYENRPQMIIQERFKNCNSVMQLAEQAKSKGYQVIFEPGGFLNDIQMHEGYDSSTKLKNHTIRSAKLFLENL